MGIGPSSKETTLHHFRDPLVEIVSNDKDVDLLGIIVAGTPEVIYDKEFISKRIADIAEGMRADGAIVSIDSWGNSHVDFTTAIEEISKKNITTVGMSFVGNQASFVVTNKYMDTIIDFNKTEKGIETCVVGENNVVELDVIKALAVLKTKMNKKKVKKNNTDTIFGSEDIETKVRSLIIKEFKVEEVKFSDRTKIENNTLFIRREIVNDFKKLDPLIKDVNLNIIYPDNHNMFINSIMDISPIATKVTGRVGEGITHVLSGARVMLTGVEEGGFQPSNIGSSEGILREQIKFGRRGTPSEDDIIIHIDVELKNGEGRTKEGISSAHSISDKIIQEIRQCLKSIDSSVCSRTKEYFDIVRPNKKKVVIVKLVSGLGCMYDTGILPYEPGGYVGCKSIIDLGNMPLVLSANKYRDGVIRNKS